MPDHFEKAMQKYNYYKLNLGKPINLKETKNAATSKLFSVKYCKIHNERLIKGLMIPMETELNN